MEKVGVDAGFHRVSEVSFLKEKTRKHVLKGQYSVICFFAIQSHLGQSVRIFYFFLFFTFHEI